MNSDTPQRPRSAVEWNSKMRRELNRLGNEIKSGLPDKWGFSLVFFSNETTEFLSADSGDAAALRRVLATLAARKTQ